MESETATETETATLVIPDANCIIREHDAAGKAVATDGPATNNSRRRIYVELDTTFYFNNYRIPTQAEIVHAVHSAFSFDDTKTLLKLFGRDRGLYILETQHPERYDKMQDLEYGGKKIAKVSLKAEEKYEQNGKVITKRSFVNEHGETVKSQDRKNEILITLYNANTQRFKDVTDDELHRRIVNMDVGRIKRAVTIQTYQDSNLPNGNKYFVLAGLQEGDLERLPQSFDFHTEEGVQRMWLNYYGKKRKCRFCSKFHDGECPVQAQIRNMEQERDQIRKELGHFPTKTYTDSTMRYASQNALACDLDAMSGGTMGNIINTVEVDEDNENVKNIVIVGGANDITRDVPPQEFLWTMAKTKERMQKLAGTKNSISILPPPHRMFVSNEDTVRQQYLKEALTELSSVQNITIWENPLKAYEEDDGQHPSPIQTEQLLRYIDAMMSQQHGPPYVLQSATPETITTTKKYGRVNSLYKFGCSACSSRKKNKWYHICLECKEALQVDEQIKERKAYFDERVVALHELTNPSLPATNQMRREENVSADGVRSRSPLRNDLEDTKKKPFSVESILK